MKLSRKPLKQQALLIIYDDRDALFSSVPVPPNQTTAEIIMRAAAVLGITEEELLKSRFQLEYWNN